MPGEVFACSFVCGWFPTRGESVLHRLRCPRLESPNVTERRGLNFKVWSHFITRTGEPTHPPSYPSTTAMHDDNRTLPTRQVFSSVVAVVCICDCVSYPTSSRRFAEHHRPTRPSRHPNESHSPQHAHFRIDTLRATAVDKRVFPCLTMGNIVATNPRDRGEAWRSSAATSSKLKPALTSQRGQQTPRNSVKVLPCSVVCSFGCAHSRNLHVASD